MITEEEFEKHCASVELCEEERCKFYKECRTIRKNGTDFNNFYSVLYKKLVKYWRKEKLAKLLSQ